MALDAFSAQLVQMVRSMSDEAILDLVRAQIGAAFMPVAVAPARRPGRPPSAPTAAAPRPAKRPGRKPGRRSGGGAVTSAAREATLAAVEKAVKGGKGLSSSQVAKVAGIPQPRAAAALKQLKQSKRIFQGGDRRFARYAADLRTAQAASEHSRRTASGPIVKGSKRK